MDASELTMPQNMVILVLIIFLTLGMIIVFLRKNLNQDFEEWFDKVVSLALTAGYDPIEVDDFEEMDFYDEYIEGRTPEQALKNYKNAKTTQPIN